MKTQQKKVAAMAGAIGFLLMANVAQVGADNIVPKYRLDQGSQLCRDLTFSNSSWASEGSALFQKNCKSCHYRDNGKGIRALHSESFTTKGWSRVFFEKYPKCAQDGSWSTLDKEQLLKVNDYLFRNAYGTWDPNSDESCG